jgi:hypothetical protein
LQAKLARPVLTEQETLYLISYMPSIAGVIGRMARDLYGLDFSDRPLVNRMRGSEGITDLTRTDAVWESRPRDQWRSLGAKYRFRFVVSRVRLDLPQELEALEWKLYTIP